MRSATAVELIALNPDAEELDYRRYLTRPDLTRYREGYDEAKKIGDEFAPASTSTCSRRPSGRLSGPSRSSRRCSPAAPPRRRARRLQAQPAADPEIQAACLKLGRDLARTRYS